MKQAPRIESEQPPDNLPKGEYPCEVVSLTLAIQEGTAKETGREYRFANGRLGLRVIDGPAKGQTAFIGVGGKGGFPLTTPKADAPLDANKRKMVNYFVQHAYDAIGLGTRLDPQWKRSEKPHPTSAGKTIVSFNGACLNETDLIFIAESQDDIRELESVFTGGGKNPCRGLFRLDLAKTDDGKEFQQFKAVRPLTDANLADWRSKSQTAASSVSGSNIYAGTPAAIKK